MAHEELYAAARTDDVAALRRLLRKDPEILSLGSIEPSDNPLHVAALQGHRKFAKAVMQENPKLSIERNNKGYYPIHLASSRGHCEIVDDIIKYQFSWPLQRGFHYRGQCFLKDLHGRTPLHLAAIREQLDVVQVLLTSSAEGPEAAKEVNFKKETVLHLVVKYNLCEVMELLLSLLGQLNIFDELVNCEDEDGNTVLQLAAARKQGQILKLLSSTNTKVEAIITNNSGMKTGFTWFQYCPPKVKVLSSNLTNENSVKSFDTIKRKKIMSDGGLISSKTSVMDSSEPKMIENSSKVKSSKRDKLLNRIIILNSLFAAISFCALLTLPGGLLKSGQPENVTKEVAAAPTLQNLANSYLQLPMRLIYAVYKSISIAEHPLLNLTAPDLQGPVEAMSFTSVSYNFLGYDAVCFFFSLATIVMALLLCQSSCEQFFFVVSSVMTAISAGYLYASVSVLVASTPSAFLLVALAGVSLVGAMVPIVFQGCLLYFSPSEKRKKKFN